MLRGCIWYPIPHHHHHFTGLTCCEDIQSVIACIVAYDSGAIDSLWRVYGKDGGVAGVIHVGGGCTQIATRQAIPICARVICLFRHWRVKADPAHVVVIVGEVES